MLNGKEAVITGGSRGIGKAIAFKLASLGAEIAVIYVGNVQAAVNVCNGIRNDYGKKAKAYCCDVSCFEAVKETISQIKSEFTTVHILVVPAMT